MREQTKAQPEEQDQTPSPSPGRGGRPAPSGTRTLVHLPLDAPLQREDQVSPGPVLQRSLVEDLVDQKTSVAIVGETHGAIPVEEEQQAWGRFGVRVVYEAERLSPNTDLESDPPAVTPDSPLLRAMHLWVHVSRPLATFWQAVIDGEDYQAQRIRLGNFQEVKKRLQDELQTIGLERAPELQNAYDLVDTMPEDIPQTWPAFAKLGTVALTTLAHRQRERLKAIEDELKGLHRRSVNLETPWSAPALMTRRSEVMLSRINAAVRGMKKTIYKVGDHHVTDMRREQFAPAAGVAIYSMAEYGAEIPRPTQAGMGNLMVSSAYDNDNL